ncbi:MAG: TonB-dependent receptor plug [Gemmatimonadetes bacterium]|nr:TonB-dependent receptor plug [Gemmatimonadota bacterium]
MLGVVYDSISRAPFRGATVQIAQQSAGSRVYTTQADSDGRFIIENVPPGRYLAGFFHFALDTLGLEPPVRLIDVGGTDQQRLSLGTPSPRSVARALCGRASGDSIGALYARVYDARSGEPVVGATLVATWHELVNSGEVVRHEEPTLDARSNVDGWAVVCGLPGGSPVSARVNRGPDTSGVVMVNVPGGGFLRRDFRMGGSTRLAGVVKGVAGAPLANAQVRFAGGGAVVRTDASGAFNLPSHPAGSQTLEARAAGYALLQRTMDIEASRPQPVELTLSVLPELPDSARPATGASGFEERRRAGAGRYVSAHDLDLLDPFGVSDILRGMPGVAVSDEGLNHVVTFAAYGGRCIPALLLNGSAIHLDARTNLDSLVRPDDVLGLEVYTHDVQPPSAYQSAAGECGTIVIWTGRTRHR